MGVIGSTDSTRSNFVDMSDNLALRGAEERFDMRSLKCCSWSYQDCRSESNDSVYEQIRMSD